MINSALILCGGQGTRFRSVSENPKILATFRGNSFLKWLVDYLYSHEIQSITLSVGYRAQEIIDYVNNNQHLFPTKLKFMQEPKPLGTGGAVYSYFQHINEEAVCVVNGDTYWTGPIPKEIFHLSKNETIKCLVSRVKENTRYGDVSQVGDKLTICRGTLAKPIKNSLVFSGIYSVKRSACLARLLGEFSLEDVICAQKQRVTLVESKVSFLDFGIAEDYEKLIYDYK